MTTFLYLEHYLDSLESLPGELRRNFTLMHDLDVKNQSILREADEASDDYLKKVRELSPTRRKQEMEKIQKLFKKAKEHGDDKVSIAVQTYELVDKHIRRLDSDLAKFEAEMREKGGKLSQTETEEDEEDTNETDGKKKGKKKTIVSARDSTKLSSVKKRGKKDVGVSIYAIAVDDKKKKKKGSVTPKLSETPMVGIANSLLPVPQEVLDMPVDPNEPTYCLCQQVSYGEMIGCDNPDCPIEWFHFGCMSLTAKPKGKWYCPKCLPMFKKKK